MGLARIGREDPWFRNADMNVHNMVDAICLNSNIPPNIIDQPGVPMKTLLALHYRLQGALGHVRVWNLEQFGASSAPLEEIPPLIRSQRKFSRGIVLVIALLAGLTMWTLTRDANAALFTAVLFSGSSALLFHGLLTRPELLCVGFGSVGALLCTALALRRSSGLGQYLWLLLAGLMVGLAFLSKLPGVVYLGLCAGWCGIHAVTASSTDPTESKSVRWGAALPLLAGAGGLFYLKSIQNYQGMMGELAVSRLHVVSILIVCTSVLFAVRGKAGWVRFGLDRLREGALIGAGFIIALPLTYTFLRLGLSEAVAQDYFSRVGGLLFNPEPMMNAMAVNTDIGGQFQKFITENRRLFTLTVILYLVLLPWPSVPLRRKLQVSLLLAVGFGLTLLMSKRYYLHQYNVFSHGALWMAVALCVQALWQAKASSLAKPLRVAVVSLLAIAGAVHVATGPARAQDFYLRYQDDSQPDNMFTRIFLFDHDAHPPAYTTIMREHYQTKEGFAAALKAYLETPENHF